MECTCSKVLCFGGHDGDKARPPKPRQTYFAAERRPSLWRHNPARCVICFQLQRRNAPAWPQKSVRFSGKPRRQTLQTVTAPVHAARNPAPTSSRHILLQLYGAIPDGLAYRVQKYFCARDDAAAASGRNRQTESDSASSGIDQEEIAKEELAPGGHQEQGESRVTVFRAPDWEKASGAEVANDIATAPLAKEYQRMRMNAT